MMPIRLAAVALLLAIAPSALADDATALKPDTSTQVGMTEAVCTGVGLEARQNPAWAAYPLKIEVAGKGGQYLGDIRLTLRKGTATIATVTCDGPWVLFKTQAGAYRVDVETEGQTASSNAYVPDRGQGRIIVRFPLLGAEVSPKVAPPQQSSSPTTN
jgi:hypothetical protein